MQKDALDLYVTFHQSNKKRLWGKRVQLKCSYVGPRYRVLTLCSVNGSALMCIKHILTAEECLVLFAHDYTKFLLYMFLW